MFNVNVTHTYIKNEMNDLPKQSKIGEKSIEKSIHQAKLIDEF